MLFNSSDFAIFFVIVYCLFFLFKGTARHLVLFFASCVFYAWFIPKYLAILFILIFIDYFAAIKIEGFPAGKKRGLVLLVAILNTCGVLFIFKYHNFFVDSINSIGNLRLLRWDLILPIGLSFHTFQSLSYVIDVYMGKLKAERNLLIYANYVLMFPQLVAGPIERGGHLLPQLQSSFTSKISNSDFTIGMTGFFYGLFKKVVVADSIGLYVDSVYNNYTHHNSATLALATLLFSIQIYADFSGYSDMAIGIARTLGFKFSDNFKTPYFSTSITEFWRRWHISLSSWLRDYLYYPLVLGWGKVSKYKLYASTLITFTLIGLWHGANWTFVVFGTIHGLYLVFELMTKNARLWIVRATRVDRLPILYHAATSSLVFILVSISFIFFRSPTMAQASAIARKVTIGFSSGLPNLLDVTTFATICLSVLLLFVSEYFIFSEHSFEDIYNSKRGFIFSSLLIASSIILILSFGQIGGKGFIYFQF